MDGWTGRWMDEVTGSISLPALDVPQYLTFKLLGKAIKILSQFLGYEDSRIPRGPVVHTAHFTDEETGSGKGRDLAAGVFP